MEVPGVDSVLPAKPVNEKGSRVKARAVTPL